LSCSHSLGFERKVKDLILPSARARWILLESAREALQILQVATQAKAFTHTERKRET